MATQKAKKLVETEERLEKLEEKSKDVNRYSATEEEEEIRQRVYDRYKAMKDAETRGEAETEWDMGDKSYEAYVEAQDDDDYRTNINKPIAFSIIETELQETIDRRPRPLVKPREYSDNAKVQFINDALDYSFDIGNFDYQYYLAKKESLIRGTGFLFEYYREDSRVVSDMKMVKDEENPGEFKEEYNLIKRVDFEDVYAEYIPNEMIYVGPEGNHISKKADAIIREVIDIDAFRQKYDGRRGYVNIDKVVAGGDTSHYTFYSPDEDVTAHDVEVLHYYNRTLDRYDVVANDIPIRYGPNPNPHKEIPLVPIYCYKRPNRFYGFGIPKIIKSPVEERNTLSNLRLDYQKMGINKMFFYDETVELDELDLVTRPHGGVPVSTNGRPVRDVIQWMEYGDVKPSSYREEEILIEDIRRATGIDDRVQGVNAGGTATEAAILKESSMKRINAKETLNEMDGLIRLGRLRLENIRFYYTIPKITRIVEANGEEKVTRKPKEIRVEGKTYSFDEQGNLQMAQTEGYSFFEVKGKAKALFNDMAEYDIEMEAGSSGELSKPLKQQKVAEMVDRITANPMFMKYLEPRKALQRYISVNDEDSREWVKKEYDTVDMQMQAEMENRVMASGYPLPPTPGADETHTIIHIMHTKTADYQQYPEELQSVYEAHIMGEAGERGDLGDKGPEGVESPGMDTQELPPDLASQLGAPGMERQDVMPNVAPTAGEGPNNMMV
jgi:hypothetical protein